MDILLIVLHVIFCLFLILVILLQTGKGSGMGTAFGGSSQSVFGPRGAGSFIGKLTGIVAVLFMLSSIVLAYRSSSRSSGIADKVNAAQAQSSQNAKEVDLGKKAPVEGQEEAQQTPDNPLEKTTPDTDKTERTPEIPPAESAAPSATPVSTTPPNNPAAPSPPIKDPENNDE